MKFERTNGCGGIVRLMYHEARSFEEGRGVYPDEGVVFHKENRNAFGFRIVDEGENIFALLKAFPPFRKSQSSSFGCGHPTRPRL
jgi:hypothetical protein